MAVQGIIPPSFKPPSHDLGVLSTTWKDFKQELTLYFGASGQENVETIEK